MKKAQFAERQYETSFHIELTQGGKAPFVPTQAMEMYLGIDAAADPVRTHAIWRILSVQIPQRVQLTPGLWPRLPPRFHEELPGKYCSLFLQFKIPVFQDSARAKYHGRLGGSYYEVQLTSHQQKSLVQLENRVQTRSLVRYASPAFWSRHDFDGHDQKRDVIAHSAFVSPFDVKSHRKWMYVDVGRKGVLNPDPEEIRVDGWESILQILPSVSRSETLRQHVRALAEQLSGEREDSEGKQQPNWFPRISQYGRFSQEDFQFLLDLSTVSQAAENADTSWIVMLWPNQDWEVLLKSDPRPWLYRYWLEGFSR